MPYWQFLDNYNNDDSGRIWIGWDPSIAKLSVLHSASHCIFVLVDSVQVFSFVATFVYGDNNNLNRRSLWEDIYFLPPGISDHSLGVASIFEKRKHGTPSFRFFNFMTEEHDFLDLVRKVWISKVRGNPMFIFMTKLRKVKAPIIEWKRLRFKNLYEHVMEAKTEMISVQQQVQVSLLCHILVRKEKEAMQHYEKVARYEESKKKQRSRVHWIEWLDLGDSNTHFFHNSLKERRFRNNIPGLTSRDGDVLVDDKETKLWNVFSLFSELYDEKGVVNVELIEELYFDKMINEESKNDLIKPVSRDEVVASLSSIGSGKASGPDGFSSYFFKVCWNIIGDDFVATIQNVFKSSKLLKEVKRISIQYNIMLAHEIVMNYHRSSGSPRCAMKIDLRKAYDTVSWNVVSTTMRKTGFPDLFNGWVEQCVTYPKFSILINGSPYGSLVLIDNVIVFFKGTSQVVVSLKIGIVDFGDCSGLHMNQHKTSLFAFVVADRILQDILSIMDSQENKLPVNGGGLGVRDVEINNVSANLRRLWDLLSDKDSIWNDWVKKNLIKGKDIWSLAIPQDASWC
ncbi:uncharacterized protein LOC113343484 [Papaver somniferum]|uniref:uncharacterized protein LOC113343484 n=1 Tax=Papaver somniferum TaxID=3469 RepID=UPI000E6F9D8A|nr:uncharacterized protein LOC113343484 [Papaver somniferum]